MLGPFVLFVRVSDSMPETRPVITFSKREGGMPMPNLLDIQTAAFQTLLVPDDVEEAEGGAVTPPVSQAAASTRHAAKAPIARLIGL